MMRSAPNSVHLLGHAIFLFVLGYGTCEDANFPLAEATPTLRSIMNTTASTSTLFTSSIPLVSHFRTRRQGLETIIAYYSVQKRIILLFV